MNEGLTPSHIAKSVEAFTNIPPQGGVNNFVIEGPVQEGATLTRVTAALFPPVVPGGEGAVALISGDEQDAARMRVYYTRVMGLSVSERIKSFKIPDNKQLRERVTAVCRLQGMPFMTISFATYENTGDPLVILHSIAGIAPETALSELQNVAQQRLASLE